MDRMLRITLLAVSLAIGIAIALGVGLRAPKKMAGVERSTSASQRLAPLDSSHSGASLDPNHSAAVPGSSRPAGALLSSPPPPVEAPYRDLVARQVGQLEETIQQIEESSHRRERSMLRAIANLQEQIEVEPPTAATAPAPVVGPPAEVLPSASADVHRGEGDDKLIINTKDSDIRTVLEMLSQEAGINIMAGPGVTGTVTANLSGVDVWTALAAILKSTGFVAQREGNIIYVGKPADLAVMQQTQDQIRTRIYRPNYIRAAELQALITPMLTPSVGKVTISSPAEVDIPSDQTKTGGNSFPGIDVVIVRDYAAVLAEVDQIFAEVDVKPRQVAIEAMILSVKLSDSYKLGVNFEALRSRDDLRLVSGSPLASLANINFADGGMKLGFMDADLGLFIDALEKIGDTNVIAAPRLTCLNKQRAEIQIGEELGYVSTTVTESSATQTVNFLDVGTLLRIRPFIDSNGMIRLEVHPELSTGSVEVQQGLSLPQKAVTQVTTQVLCPDGCTVIIGGLIREDLTTTTGQLPWLGNLPWLGHIFRQKTETIDRNEIIVLITPRIVSEPFMCEEGKKYGNAFTHRQAIYFDKMSPIGKRNLGLLHLRKARAAMNAGDTETAMKQVNLAIHYDPLSRDAVVLRNELVEGGGFHDESIHDYLRYGMGFSHYSPFSGRHRDYSKQGYPWKEFEGFGMLEPAGMDDPGIRGPARTIMPPAPGAPPGPEGLPPAGGPVPPVLYGPPPSVPMPAAPMPGPSSFNPGVGS